MSSHQQPKDNNDAAIKEWQKDVSAKREASKGIDWSGVDWSKLTARDVGVQFGPPMTEEQFKEYQKKRGGGDVTVIKRSNA